jgi:hypothetical protein
MEKTILPTLTAAVTEMTVANVQRISAMKPERPIYIPCKA